MLEPSCLNPREEKILAMRFGLEDGIYHTLKLLIKKLYYRPSEENQQGKGSASLSLSINSR